jgi:hypothetical protein
MPRNQKLTRIIAGRTVKDMTVESGGVLVLFDDESRMKIKTGEPATIPPGGKVKSVYRNCCLDMSVNIRIFWLYLSGIQFILKENIRACADNYEPEKRITKRITNEIGQLSAHKAFKGILAGQSLSTADPWRRGRQLRRALVPPGQRKTPVAWDTEPRSGR